MDIRLLIILAVLALVAGLVVGQFLRRSLDDAKADGGWFAKIRKRSRRFVFDYILRRGRGESKRESKRDGKRRDERGDKKNR